jgi:hypothetical protein
LVGYVASKTIRIISATSHLIVRLERTLRVAAAFILLVIMLNKMNDQTIISQFLNAQDFKYPLKEITDLSLKDALYLISFIRSSTIINSDHIGGVTNVPPFAPAFSPDGSPEGLAAGVLYLIDRKLITFSTYTKNSAFTIVNNKVESYDLVAINWKIYIENVEAAKLQLNEIIANSNWPIEWRHDIKTIWLEIAISECIEYLEFLAYERGFNIEITDNLQSNILTLLRINSVSQCFYLISDAMLEVSDNIQKNTISKDDADNYFIKCCFQKRKKTSEFKDRPYGLPQSKLSSVFHYDFLKIGEAGFTDIPHDL